MTRVPDPVDSVRAAIGRRKGGIAAAAVLLTTHQLGEGAVPVVLGAAIDDAVNGGDPWRLVLWLAVLAAAFTALSLSWRFGARNGARVRLGIAHELRVAVGAAALDGRASIGGGALLTLAVSDARRVGDAVRLVLGALAGAILLLGSLAAIAWISPLLAAIVLVAAIAMLAVVGLLSRPIEARSRAEQEADARAAASAVDLIAGLRVLAGLRAGRAAAARYRGVSRDAVRHATRAARAEGAVAGLAALLAGAYLAVVGAASAFAAAHGTMSIGDVIAVLGLSQLLIDPLQGLAGVWPAVRRGRASGRRIDTVLRAERPAAGTAEAPRAPAPSLGLDAVAAPGLDGVTLRIGAGSFHGLVAPDPAVAGSIVALLGGEQRADRGRVLVEEHDLAKLRPDAARTCVLAWPHGAFPPGETVAEVLGGRTPGRSGPGDDGPVGPASAMVLAATAADDVLDRLPDGADAVLTEQGAALSGGERQRLALARLLLADPPALVLEDPTSALDAVTEAAVAGGLHDVRRGRTTLVLTASPAILGRCDRVTLILDGTVRAEGTHAELLQRADYRAAVAR